MSWMNESPRSGLFGLFLLLTLPGGLGAEEAPVTKEAKEAALPTLLIIQGKLKAEGAETYQRYLAGAGPLLVEYQAQVAQVGKGLESEFTTAAWPINAVLEFPSREAAEGFLGDPRHLELKTELRDQVYEELHLTLVESLVPNFRSAKDVALEAFEELRRGLATGSWEGFLERLSEDFTFRFPSGKFQGTQVGREKAREFFSYVSRVFPDGLEVLEIEAVTVQENRVFLEFHNRGELEGKLYENQIAIAFEVCGEEVCGYREYFRLVGPPPETAAE